MLLFERYMERNSLRKYARNAECESTNDAFC